MRNIAFKAPNTKIFHFKYMRDKSLILYLVWKSFHQNGHQEIEENIISKCHKGNKIQSSPMTCSLHSGKKNNIPILLGQYLEYKIQR